MNHVNTWLLGIILVLTAVTAALVVALLTIVVFGVWGPGDTKVYYYEQEPPGYYDYAPLDEDGWSPYFHDNDASHPASPMPSSATNEGGSTSSEASNPGSP